MTLINTIKNLKERGMSNNQIIQLLKERNYKPQEINNALQQASIKSAISTPQQTDNQSQEMQTAPAPEPQPPQQPPTSQTQNQYTQPAESQAEQMQMNSPSPTQNQQQPETEEYIPQTPAQDYSYYDQYSPQSSGTVNDIAEEIIEEKIQEIRKNLEKLGRFQTSTKRKISNLDNRLKKIEKTIEDLQQKIIGKIGNYGEAIENIKEDMNMMQDSFSKALDPLIKKGRKSKSRKKKS